jgi:C-terminal processing protease CtpA/Prc
VLIDNRTASSGEATAISLQARPSTRFFGTPSCGASTGNVSRQMRNGDVFIITQSIMADRNGRAFGDQIQPDEVITVEADVFARAIGWLQAQP